MPLGPMKTKAQKQSGVRQVMHEFKHGALHSGSKKGPVVKSRKQAIAIAMSQTGQSRKQSGGRALPDPKPGYAELRSYGRAPYLARAIMESDMRQAEDISERVSRRQTGGPADEDRQRGIAMLKRAFSSPLADKLIARQGQQSYEFGSVPRREYIMPPSGRTDTDAMPANRKEDRFWLQEGGNVPLPRPDPRYELTREETRGVPPDVVRGWQRQMHDIRARGTNREYARGGAPWYQRQAMNKLSHEGPINSGVPGRTDKHNMSVASGSYVLPADTVSHIGQNNTQAGGNILNKIFGRNMRPTALRGHDKAMPGVKMKKFKPFAKGGSSKPVEVVTAGGEYVVHPDVVREIGEGDMKLGHDRLDQFVKLIRKDHIKTLKKLPGPKK